MKKTIVYNIKSLPENMVLEEVLEMYYATGVLLYEGEKEPYAIDVDNLDQDIVIIKYNEWLNLNYATH